MLLSSNRIPSVSSPPVWVLPTSCVPHQPPEVIDVELEMEIVSHMVLFMPDVEIKEMEPV